MGLKERLDNDIKAAMKAGDAEKRDALRLILAAIIQVEVDTRQELDDTEIEKILSKQVKQNRESAEEYESVGKDELAAKERYEMELTKSYLPQQMSRAEIEVLVSETIAELGVSGPKATGQVMSRLMPQLQGKADGRLVSEVVRDKLKS